MIEEAGRLLGFLVSGEEGLAGADDSAWGYTAWSRMRFAYPGYGMAARCCSPGKRKRTRGLQ